MAPRITLVDPAERQQPQADGLMKSVLQDDVSQLINAGIVTHKITNSDALDAVFAVSQVRDLPEVSFAAAFDHGVILLRCPDGPPDSLAKLVEPVTPDISTPAPAPDMSEKLDRLAAQVAALQNKADDRIGAGLGRIESISHRLEFIADALKPEENSPDTTPSSTDLSADLAALQESLAAVHAKLSVAEAQDIAGRFDALESRLDLLSTAADTRSDKALETLKGIAAQMETAAGKPLEADTISTHLSVQMADALEPMRARMDTLNTAVAELDTRMESVGMGLRHHQTDVTQIAQGVSEVQAKLAAVTDLVSRNATDPIQSQIEGLKAAWSDTASQGAQKVTDILDRFGDQLTNATKLIASPGQQETFTALQANTAALADRLDTLARTQPAQTKQTDTQAIEAQLVSLSDRLSTFLDQHNASPTTQTPPEEFTKLSETLDTLPSMLAAAMDQPLAGLQQDVKRLANLPPPVVDLTEHRREFANFTTVMSSMTQRFEGAAELMHAQLAEQKQTPQAQDVLQRMDALPQQVADALPVSEDLNRLDTRIDAFITDITRRMDAMTETAKGGLATLEVMQARLSDMRSEDQAPPVDLEPISDQLAALTGQTSALPDAIAALQTDIERLAQKPAPVLDLTAQRESFARFGTAAATVMKRLEGAIAHVENGINHTEADAASLRAIAQALPVALHQAIEDARQNDTVAQMMSDLRNAVTRIAGDIHELAEVRDLMESVARRPDPIPDMSEQRRGFARFATALSTVVKRLERISDHWQNAVSASSDFSPVEQGMQAIQSEIGAFAASQSQKVQLIDERLAELSRTIASAQRPPAARHENTSFVEAIPAGQVSLEEMRFMFAELVAIQIRDNTARTQKTV